jgi:hypothetical protein
LNHFTYFRKWQTRLAQSALLASTRTMAAVADTHRKPDGRFAIEISRSASPWRADERRVARPLAAIGCGSCERGNSASATLRPAVLIPAATAKETAPARGRAVPKVEVGTPIVASQSADPIEFACIRKWAKQTAPAEGVKLRPLTKECRGRPGTVLIVGSQSARSH